MPGVPAAAGGGEAGMAPAVDWQQEVSDLLGSAEWGELLRELGGSAGGPSVAALLRRAATQLAAGAGGGGGSGGGSGSGGGGSRLPEAVQQVAWEKLHTGDWHNVAVVWRDAYVAACILAAAAGLPGGADAGPEGTAAGAGLAAGSAGEPQAAAGPAETAAAAPAAAGPAAPAAGEPAALSAALWHLDMAAIMGGPRLRARVDARIEALQRRWQQLHAGAQLAGGERQQEEKREEGKQQEQEGEPREGRQGSGDGERAAKRHRAASPASSAGDDAGAGAPRAAAAAQAQAASEAALLPPWSLGPRGCRVATEELPSLEAFWRDYMSTDTPVVISGAMEDWPALARWSDPAYFVRVAGPRTIPVEVGEHYLSEQWGQQLMTLQSFVGQHLMGSSQGRAGGTAAPAAAASPGASGAAAAAGTAEQPAQAEQAGPSERAAAAEPGSPGGSPLQRPPGSGHAQPASSRPRGYLAQHPLFDQIPALAADIREPPYCCLGEGEVQSVNAWIGPAGTVTPLHTDPHPNLLCQAVGRKYVRLYPPSATPAMYPHAEGMHTNSGRVDVDAPDLEAFPLFGQAAFQDCVLEAGHMLFIPPGWWHYVRSTALSCSVSFWWR